MPKDMFEHTWTLEASSHPSARQRVEEAMRKLPHADRRSIVAVRIVSEDQLLAWQDDRLRPIPPWFAVTLYLSDEPQSLKEEWERALYGDDTCPAV